MIKYAVLQCSSLYLKAMETVDLICHAMQVLLI